MNITVETIEPTEEQSAFIAEIVDDVLEQLGATYDYVEYPPDLSYVKYVNVVLPKCMTKE